MNIILSVLSGILLSLSFPKANLFWLAWVALVPLLIALTKVKNLKESLWCGLFFGLFFFGLDLFWVITALLRFAGWWVLLGWGVFTLFQTLFILLFILLLRLVKVSGVAYPVIVAALWTFVEWFRALGPFGFTSGDIGYTQVSLLPLIQIASLISVYGITFLVVLFNAAVVNLFKEPRRSVAGSLTLITFILLVIYAYGVYQMPAPPKNVVPTIKLSLVQANIDQMEKLDATKVMPIFAVHEKMTRLAARAMPDIIVWPETAIFSYVLRDARLFPRLKVLCQETKTWLVFGTPHYTQGKAYNSIVAMSPAGEVVAHYNKEKLVPFGEYLPFRPILYPLLKKVGYYDAEFSPGKNQQPFIANDLTIAGAICFESVFPGLMRSKVSQKSAFILLVTNDAWFNKSSVPYYHLNAGILRAIENRRYFVQVGNSGLSAVIDPYGRVLSLARPNQQEILTFEIPRP